MTCILRLAAVGCLWTLLAGPSRPAGADDPAPAAPAGQAGLTDADRAFFAWWDTKGFPDVGKLPFVTLDEPERGVVGDRHSKEREAFPAGAFLIRDDGKRVTLFLTDLQTLEAPLKAATKGEEKGWNRAVEYRKADLAAWVRQGLDIVSKEGPEIPWFDKSDPFGAHRWSIPNQAFRIAVLARALAARGEDALARTMCDRALHEETRPAMTEQYGDDDPRPRASYESIQASIESESRVVLEERFGDPRLSWEDLLAAHEAWARAFSPKSLSAKEGSIPILRRMAEDARARKASPPKPLDRQTPPERLQTLIHDLQEVGGTFFDTWGFGGSQTDEKKGPQPANVQLEALGFDAVPALIEALDDVRFTRTLEYYETGHGQYRSSFHVLQVGEMAWMILDRVASGALKAANAGGPPTSGRPTRRRAAEEWFSTVKARGEKAILIEQIAKGTWESRAAADRLVKLDPEAAVKPLETGILAGGERAGRANLVYVLASLKSPSAVGAMLRLLDPLRGSEEATVVAASLWKNGKREGLDALIRWWKEAGSPAADSSPFGFGGFGARHLVGALVGTGDPDAVRALAAGIGTRSTHDRVEIVRAFAPRGKDGWREPHEMAMKAEAEPLIETLLAERLSDGDRAEGLHMGSEGIGDEPVVGEMAAWTLAERYPSRWKFDEKASEKDRATARVALANRWRAAHGQSSLEETKPKIDPLPPEKAKPLVAAWLAAGDDEAAREVAEAAIVSAGLGALPAVQAARDALKADEPRRERLDAFVRRLACLTREIHWSQKGPKPNEALTAYVNAMKGQPMTGPWITGLWRQVAEDTPEGATGIDLTFYRPGDGTGGVLDLELTTDRTPWGGGDDGWILNGDGMELVDDDFLKDGDSWWHKARGPQVDGRLLVREDRSFRMRWVIKRGRG